MLTYQCAGRASNRGQHLRSIAAGSAKNFGVDFRQFKAPTVLNISDSCLRMLSQVTFNREKWIAALMLDPETGLDPPDVKVRAAQGLLNGLCTVLECLDIATQESMPLRRSSKDTGFGRRSWRTSRSLDMIQTICSWRRTTGGFRFGIWRSVTDIFPG